MRSPVVVSGLGPSAAPTAQGLTVVLVASLRSRIRKCRGPSPATTPLTAPRGENMMSMFGLRRQSLHVDAGILQIDDHPRRKCDRLVEREEVVPELDIATRCVTLMRLLGEYALA